MSSERYEFTLFGNEFRVVVKEGKHERKVQLQDYEQWKRHGHSYVLSKNEKEESSGGLLSEPKELPPRRQQIMRTVNDGIEKWLQKESKERNLSNDVELAAERVADFWREEFDQGKDFE